MTDLSESQLTEALQRRADERTPPALPLAELHHRARSVPGSSTSVPTRRPRLLMVGAAAAVAVVAAVGGWRALADDDQIGQRIDSAGQPDGVVDDGSANIDPDDPLTWPVDDGSPERFRKGPNGEIATFEGEVINDEVTVFLDGWFLATWDESEATWTRPAAEPGTGIETGLGETISDDLSEVTESPGVLATEACLIPGQETWAIDGEGFDGLHVYADRPELAGLLPRPVTEISPRPVDVADVEEALAGTGLDPNITRVLRFDADGDGVDEVLIEANTLAADTPEADTVEDRTAFIGDGDQYSLLLLRRVGADGEAETIELHRAIGEDDQIYLLWMTVAAVADVNGDGSFELVTRSNYFEGFGGSIWTLGETPTEVVEGGCGA